MPIPNQDPEHREDFEVFDNGDVSKKVGGTAKGVVTLSSAKQNDLRLLVSHAHELAQIPVDGAGVTLRIYSANKEPMEVNVADNDLASIPKKVQAILEGLFPTLPSGGKVSGSTGAAR